MDFCYTMTFLQCVHGVYDEKMEAVYQKFSRKGSFGEDTESTLFFRNRPKDTKTIWRKFYCDRMTSSVP